MADVAEKTVEEVKKVDAAAADDDDAKMDEGAKKVEEVKKVDEEAGKTKAAAADNGNGKDTSTEGGEEDEPSKSTDGSGEENGEASGLERKIIQQVEYYFSDANLRRDKFLLEQIKKDEEGWVPLSVLLTFKRLASISKDAKVIADALMKSDENLLEISEEKVRRHPERPLPDHDENARKEIMARTAYAKGFPLDIEMGELLDFFAPYEKVEHVNMRKYLDKPTKTYKFKGSIFVTFTKKEQAEEFIKKEKVLYKERELLRKWQEKYLEDKKEEHKAKSEKKKNKQKKTEEEKFELPKGTVLFFEGATEAVTRETIREAVDKLEGSHDIAYIDFSKGDKDGHLRFQDENVAVKVLEKLEEKKLKLKDDIELTLRTLSEEEEKSYLEKAVEQMKNRRQQQNKHKGNRKRRGGDYRGDSKKQKSNDNDD